jgi:hypothetical protein
MEGFRRLDRFVKVVEQQREPAADFDAVLLKSGAFAALKV